MPRSAALLLAALALAGLTACSYSTKRLTALPGARSIAVLPITNDTYRRDLELRLTQALVEQLRARTDLALASPQRADVLLSGSISAEEFAIGLGDNGEVIQKRLEGTLHVAVRDRVSGRLRRSFSVRATEEFRPGTQGESLAGSGTDEWTRRLADLVVQQLETGF